MNNRWGRSRPTRNPDANGLTANGEYLPKSIHFDESTEGYRCLCNCFHIKTGTLIVGITEIFFLIFFFVNSLLLVLTTDTKFQENAGLHDDTYIKGPFIASIVGIAISSIVVFLLFIAIARNCALLLIPHIIVQGLVLIVLLLAIISGIIAFITNVALYYRLLNAAPFNEFPNQDTVALDIETAARIYFIFFLYVLCFFLECWFLVVVYNCYRYLDERRAYMRYCLAYSTPLKTLSNR